MGGLGGWGGYIPKIKLRSPRIYNDLDRPTPPTPPTPPAIGNKSVYDNI